MALGLSHEDLIPLAEALAGEWRVLLWDMPGHGASLPGLPRYSLAGMSHALSLVLDAAGASRPVLFGFSFGGMVAQDWIRRNPDRAAGLIAYGCFAPFSQPGFGPPWLTRMIAGSLRLRPWRAVRDDFARRCALTRPAQAQVRRQVERLGKEGFVQMTRALLEGFEPDPNFRLDMPLLLIRGDLDSNGAKLAEAQDALAGLSRDATREVVQGAGHCAHLDRPEPFGMALRPFVSRMAQALTQAEPAAAR